MTYELIADLSKEYPVIRLCGILCVSTSAFYGFFSGKSHVPSLKKQGQSDRVHAVFKKHKRRYGSRRILAELRDEGMDIGRHRVRSVMKGLRLRAIQPKSFVPKTTVPCGSARRSPNLLLEKSDFPEGINEVVVGDITYLPLENGGWLYLCIWMDLCSRFIGGWKVDDNMEAALAVDSLEMLIRRRNPCPGMIVHTDGGGQFTSGKFRDLLKRNGLEQSMTRVENHYDNAFAESFFSRFKAELLDEYPVFASLEDAKNKVFEFIEGYYNVMRRHSSIGYVSPQKFEEGL